MRTYWRKRAVKYPSMKVPPKRKGNSERLRGRGQREPPLNESPSEKEGKSDPLTRRHALHEPSMKVPPKRKGNCEGSCWSGVFC